MTTPTDGQPPTSTRHVPVMLSRILDLLAPALDGVDGAVHLDGTLGMGGHAEAVLERFGHPVTVVTKSAGVLRDLATADEDRFFAELNEIFSDPLFRQIDLPKQELRDLAELCPGVTHSLQRLYAAYTEARRGETMVAAQMADQDVIGIEIETATTRGQQRLGMIELVDRTEMTPLIEHVPLSEAVLLVALDQRDRPAPGPGLGLQALGSGPGVKRSRASTSSSADRPASRAPRTDSAVKRTVVTERKSSPCPSSTSVMS